MPVTSAAWMGFAVREGDAILMIAFSTQKLRRGRIL
jgi:hypothetical protein